VTVTLSLPLGHVIFILLVCQAIAAVFVSVFTALTAILVAMFLEQKRKLEMDQEYDELADSREVFWDALRLAYSRFRESNPRAPERLEDLILTGGFPADFEQRKVKNLTQWLKENEDKLDQIMVWNFASSIYPSRQDRQTDSLIESAHAESFNEARSKLARFWNKWVPFGWRHLIVYPMLTWYLYEHYGSAGNQLIMLTWLELALIKRVGDHGREGIALFKVAAKFARELDQT
jgi:hypothetical protein